MTQYTRNPASQLGGQAALFFLGNVFTLLVGLPLQIYVARMLGAGGLGVFSLIDGGVSLAAGLIAFGLAPTLVKFIPFHLERGEYPCIRQLVILGTTILLATGALAYAVAVLAVPFATRHWTVLAEYRSAIIVMALLIPLSVISFFLQQGLRGFQEIRYIVVGSSFMQLTVKALLSVALLAAGFQLMGYVWAVVLSVLCAVIWMAVGLRRRISAMPSSGEANCSHANKNAWRDYARVMYSGSLLGIGGAYLDRFMLGALAGSGPVGVLSVVKQLQQMPVIFLQMFLAVAAPMFSAAHSRGNMTEIQHIYHLTTDWVIRLSAPLFIFFFMFADPLLRLFGAQFADEGVYPLRILLAGQLVNLGIGPVGNVLIMSGMEKQVLKLTMYQMLFTALGFLLLVPAFGLVGGAWAISASVLFSSIGTLLIAKKAVSLRWSDARYLRWIVPALVSIVAGIALFHWRPADPGLLLLGTQLFALYVLFHGLSFAQGMHADDKELLSHMRAQLAVARNSAR